MDAIGTRWEHNRIIGNLHFDIRTQLQARKSPWRVFTETFRLQTASARSRRATRLVSKPAIALATFGLSEGLDAEIVLPAIDVTVPLRNVYQDLID